MADHPAQTPIQTALMLAAIIAALVVAGVVIHRSQVREVPATQIKNEEPPPRVGVQARITIGDKSIEREWPSLDLALADGALIDETLPAGPFELEATVSFRPGKNRWARIGGEIQGGSLIVMREGEVLLSDYAGPEPKTAITRLPIWLPKKVEQLTYNFKSDGTGPFGLRAVWEPQDEAKPRPIK